MIHTKKTSKLLKYGLLLLLVLAALFVPTMVKIGRAHVELQSRI